MSRTGRPCSRAHAGPRHSGHRAKRRRLARSIDDGHVKKDGWKQQPNGIHWCALKPTDEFAPVMQRFQVPKDYWPFTIEACFSAALRRQAIAQGAYAFSGQPQSELMDNKNVMQSIWPVVTKNDPADDATFYLMAPAPEAKDGFAAWFTPPGCLTSVNYAAFEPILTGLKVLIEARKAPAKPSPPRKRRHDGRTTCHTRRRRKAWRAQPLDRSVGRPTRCELNKNIRIGG